MVDITTTIKAFSRQPEQQNYSSPTQFKFNIHKLPKVEYFATSINVPGITLGSAEQTTPFKDRPIPGDKLTYDTLQLTFLVDEGLANYQEIHGWLIGLGFPRTNQEYQNLQLSGDSNFPGTYKPSSTELGKTKYGASGDGGTYSDGTLTILSNQNNPLTEIRFRDLYPISLTGLSYDQQQTDVNYLTSTVTFQYLIYDFATVGNPNTTIVTT